MGKYNIAFVPKLKSNEFVKLAKCIINEHYSYQLGKASIPHVTICQFHYEENNLDELCGQICSESIDFIIDLSFKEISHLTFNEKVYWISLIPEDTLKIKEIFAHISKFVKSLRIDEYDPHLTLCNYLCSAQKNSIDFTQKLNEKIKIEDEFELILGECDSVGQITKIIKVLSETHSSTLSFQ